jgi:hypothetical protein
MHPEPAPTVAQPPAPAKPHRTFFGHIGHFFKHLFGAK